MSKKPSNIGRVLAFLARGPEARTPRFITLTKDGVVYAAGSEGSYWKIRLVIEEVCKDDVDAAVASNPKITGPMPKENT